MCNGSEAGSYSSPIDFVHHLTLGLRVIMKKRRGMVSTGGISPIRNTPPQDPTVALFLETYGCLRRVRFLMSEVAL